MDDDQALPILAQVSVCFAGRQRNRTPGRGLGAHRARVEAGERGRHGGDLGARGTSRVGVEPAADTAHTRISAAGGWLRKAAGLAVRPKAPDWNTTIRSPTSALAISMLSARRSRGVHSGPTTETTSRFVPLTRLPTATG